MASLALIIGMMLSFNRSINVWRKWFRQYSWARSGYVRRICADFKPYWVNIASYKAINPLWPAAAQAGAVNSRLFWNKNILKNTRTKGFGAQNDAYCSGMAFSWGDRFTHASRHHCFLSKSLSAESYSTTWHNNNLISTILKFRNLSEDKNVTLMALYNQSKIRIHRKLGYVGPPLQNVC